MTFLEPLGAKIGLSAIYDLLKGGLRQLRQRSGWERRLTEYCTHQGLELNDGEMKRLIEWIRSVDLDALSGTTETASAPTLADLIDRDVFRTWDPKLAARASDPVEWAHNNARRSDTLAAAIWGAVDAVLAPSERTAVRNAAAAMHSANVVDSLMVELGWLRDAVENLPRLVLPGLPLERAHLRLAPGVTASSYHLLWPRSGVVPFDDRGLWVD